TENVEKYIRKFRINVNHILANSDNDIDDIRIEAYLILHEFVDSIKENEKVFINELKKKCLRFNKYGKRLDSKSGWERNNRYEKMLQDEYDNGMEIDENLILGIHVIKQIISEEEYSFLLYYYDNGQEETSKRYGMTIGAIRKKVHSLTSRAKKEVANSGK
ncbi:MAG: hypothetical protein ACRC0G_17045, partial [Fusobacteriaceae bacterium]